jgi:hypothetical protein
MTGCALHPRRVLADGGSLGVLWTSRDRGEQVGGRA